MLIPGADKTPREAAVEFAAKYSDDGPRRVGTVVTPQDVPFGLNFRFVGGVRWYSVRLAPDHSGWIVEILKPKGTEQ